MQDHIPLWLKEAFSFLTVKERKGEQTSPIIKAFYAKVGHAAITNDETPWCAAFVGAILERTGIKSTKSLRARSYLKWGAALENNRIGSVAVFKRGKNPKAGHVGFVVGEERDTLLILGGNQNDQVSITQIPKSRLLSIRWPNIKQEKTNPFFKTALTLILKLEGGWSHHADDPGGATNHGITLKTYQHAINHHIVPKPQTSPLQALKTIKKDEVTTIYYELFWRRAHCQELPASLALMHFDAAVNHGVTRAIKFLQAAIAAEIDGEWGPETKTKSQTAPLQRTLDAYQEVRENHYKTRPHFKTFGRGWLKRLTTISKSAHTHLSKNQNTSTRKDPGSMARSTINRKKWWAESLTVWGTIVTALSTILPLVGPLFGLDITSEMVEQFGASVTNLIQIIGGLTGTSMALYGRSRARAKLTRRKMLVKV